MKKLIKSKDNIIEIGKEYLVEAVVKNVSSRTKVFIGSEFKNEIILDINLDKAGRLIFEGVHTVSLVSNSDEIWYFEES